MISRRAISRHGQLSLQLHTRSCKCRSLATAASGSFQYEAGDVAGIKVASRNIPGPVTQLSIIARAGTRYEPLPGFSEGLQQFAFKNTWRRSALRITRETELLGGEFGSYHSRESLVIGSKFLRQDLPYFAELLGEIITQTKYTTHELIEQVIPLMQNSRKTMLGNPTELAVNSAHGVAYHNGLGNPLYPSSSVPISRYLDSERLEAFSQAAYSKQNFAVVANGADQSELLKWVSTFYNDVLESPPAEVPTQGTTPTKYYGGQERIAHDGGNAIVFAFPGSGSVTGGFYKPEIQVLTALLGGASNIKWSPGFSMLSRASEGFPGVRVATTHHTYSDAGLLTVTIVGAASQVRNASFEVIKTLKKVAAGEFSREEVKKAVATARFQALESGQNISTGIELTGAGLIQSGKAFQLDDLAKSIGSVTEDQVKKAAKSILDGKASVAGVGDLYVLPWAEELGLHI